MSTTIFATQNPSPVVTRRPPISNEDIANDSQRSTNRRSLSDRLRNLFRRNSASPNRTASSDRRPPTARQTSTSPGPSKSPSEAPHLRAPTVNWAFGKKKPKLSSTTNTPTVSKTKVTVTRKTQQPTASSMNISSSVYDQENQRSIHDQAFAPRTPELAYGSTGRLQPSSNYEVTTAKGFRDYVIIDQTQPSQQVVVPNVDVSTFPTYTSDYNRSPTMNRQRLPNTNIEYHYHHDSSTSPIPIPMADIEIIPTPQRKRKVGDTPSLTNTQILVEKPPIYPQTSYHPPSAVQPSTVITNPTQWKSTSSSTLNNTGVHSTTAAGSSMDIDTPKLNAPLISFGNASTKKKPKRTKSQTRADEMYSSSSAISNLVRQNPVQPNRSWSSTYGSLPDAEIIHAGSISSLKPTKPSTNKYPGLSAIVHHHLRPVSVHYKDRPPTAPTTPTTSPRQPQRFETSTTTLNEYDQNQSWSHTSVIGVAPSPSPPIRCHDGYIRPMSPQEPPIQPDVSIIRIGIEDFRGRSPPSRPARYDSPDPPTVYRSSATIYTRDKHRHVDGGEIRTWCSYENGISDDYNDLYKKPYAHVHVDRKREQQTDYYNQQQVVPTKKDTYDEYRYSPRAHEQNLYEKQQKINDNQEVEEEERYEVSYEYEGHLQQYSYETQKHYDELHSTNRYSNDIDGDKNLAYSKLSSTTRSSNLTERDKTYDQSPCSYINTARIQETLKTVAPVGNSEQNPRNYTVKRSDSYDGLGILISADSETRLNHFIREVEPGSPGYQAGLRKNDRIISINGINVENVDFSNVLILIKQGLYNDNLQLSVIHEPEYN